MSYFLGADIGTTSTKAIVFSETGETKGICTEEYPLVVPQPGWAEQDPEMILQAVVKAIRTAIAQSAIAPAEIAAVGLSAATHSLIAIDRSGNCLTRNIIWADNRGLAQAEAFKQNPASHALYRRTGAPIHPVSPVTKLMWMREKDPEIFQKAARFISLKEYLLYRFFGVFAVDYSIASAGGFLNLNSLQWDAEALEIAGIQARQLSELVPTTHILRDLKPEYAQAMHLNPATPFVVGACDGVLANLGVGAIELGQVAVTIGTSSAVRTVVSQPRTDEQARTFCYALTENHWIIGGPSNNGGILLRWLRDNFCLLEVQQAQQQGVDPYQVMIEAAAKIAPGAEGLICLPYLSGERAPHWNARARGVFFGLGLHHNRSHLIRSTLEGILFAVYSINSALEDLSGATQAFRASGGFARSPIWLQLLADLCGCEVQVPAVTEGSGFGAAVLAMYAVGAIDRLEAVQQFVQIQDSYQPDRSKTEAYQRIYPLFDRLYRDNLDAFTQLARLNPA
ncbi:gluconate kinase [Microcoleus sp. FACHB-1515]|uniref:gluconokinase n=1 Tax=Cyanophyceae TaxID=3028117 RepID=UPI001681E302|nr:FGGY family carbohydrate kinase [Microcoleus sp. FACHB-1515]MBD2089620.1 gluconate kinase [Microcoleus sp. FACHB-1515]